MAVAGGDELRIPIKGAEEPQSGAVVVGGIAEFFEASPDEDASPIGFVFHFVDFKGDVWPAPHEADLATAGGVAVQVDAVECVADGDEVDALRIAYADATHAVTRDYGIAFRTAQFAKHACLHLYQRGLAHTEVPRTISVTPPKPMAESTGRPALRQSFM